MKKPEMRSRLLTLLLFVIVTTAGTSLVLRSLGVRLNRTGVDPLIWFVDGRQGGESWRPALTALEVADTLQLRSKGLYEKVFFQARVPHKGFQYPPTETFYPNQSVNGFMNRLVGNGSSIDFGDSMPEPNAVVSLVTGVSSLLLLLALAPPVALLLSSSGHGPDRLDPQPEQG